MKLLLIQGANMAALGRRQPDLYGRATARQLDAPLRRHARKLAVGLDILYTSHEGEAVAAIAEASRAGIDGILFNPAGFLHAGRALADRLRSIEIPAIEIHVTNIEKRGRRSVTADAAVGVIAGFGIDGYRLALDALVATLSPHVPVASVVGAKSPKVQVKGKASRRRTALSIRSRQLR
jgi:3-dehydroquinate dehydratase-2